MLAMLLCTMMPALAQDSARHKKVKVLPVPAFGYTPETSTYVGAVSLFTLDLYNDSLTRSSNAKLEVNYTWKKQMILEAGWDYFFKKEKWFTRGLLHYSRYPDSYYGIGPKTPRSNKVLYDSDRLIMAVNLLRNVGNKWFAGINTRYVDYRNVGLPDDELSLGTGYPELKDASVGGLGLVLLRDSRNSILTPTSGMYLYGLLRQNFSATNYADAVLDLRSYAQIGSRYTLATRLVNTWKFAEPPFYDMSILGGDRYVRGYFYGRYRDRHLSSLQSEFRFPIIWRFRGALFVGVSTLYADNLPAYSDIRGNYGAGLRFLVDKAENTHLRLDYALGELSNSGFYVSFGESF